MKEKTTKGKWKIKSNKGEVFEWFPIFTVDRESGEVKCESIQMTFNGEDHVFNFDNIFMFIYFIANEEMRRQLSLRYERRVNYIPYDVLFKLDKQEIEKGEAKRRIQLPIDEITAFYAQQEGMKHLLKNPLKYQRS